MEKKRMKKTAQGKKLLFRWGFIALIALMFIQGVRQQPQIDKNKRDIASLEQQIQYEKQRAEEVDVWTQKVDTDEYIEKVARTKLGLVKSNEKIFIDASKSNR